MGFHSVIVMENTEKTLLIIYYAYLMVYLALEKYNDDTGNKTSTRAYSLVSPL